MSDKLPVIISLTSWKDRITTVGKTIKSIIEQCNPYKVILTLSVDEFPNLIKDLPEDLLEFNKNEYLDFLWVKGNIKSFKKVLYTLVKYPNYPIVSADDDCIYTENYANILYNKWLTDKNSIWTYKRETSTRSFYFGHGPACLYPPNCFKIYGLGLLSKEIIDTRHDDIYYGVLAKMMGISVKQVLDDNMHVPYIFHDETSPLHDNEINGLICIQICLQSLTQNICKIPAEILM